MQNGVQIPKVIIFEIMSLTPEFKNRLFEACKKVLTERMENAKYAMNEAQLAANGEEKSSAGDKYETSRAMGHRDRDMYARQLAEAQNELQKIDRLNLDPTDFVKMSSLLLANDTIYFILTGIGKLEINEKVVMVVSKESPIAKAMLGKHIKEVFTFNEKQWHVLELI